MILFYYTVLDSRFILKLAKQHSMLHVVLMVSFFVNAAVCGECSYNPSNFSVTSVVPVNPLTNCLQYCRSLYAEKPQRVYYNLTSQNCEPVRFCNFTTSVYNYATNRCYNDDKFSVQNESYIPATVNQPTIVVGANLGRQMVCVNGRYNIYKIGQPGICNCDILWANSNKLDMNGFQFKCDRVTTRPEGFFLSDLTLDPQTKKVIKYGPFKASQMQVLLLNLRSLQLKQVSQYVINQTQPILFAVEFNLPQQPLIRNYEYAYVTPAVLIIFLIFAISYWEYDKLTIKITSSKLKQKIISVLHQPNLVRSIQ